MNELEELNRSLTTSATGPRETENERNVIGSTGSMEVQTVTAN